MSVVVQILGRGDEDVLLRARELFDRPADPQLVTEFLADPRHHIAVALDGDRAVGFASGVHYVHPDKEPELFINEVGVMPSHRRQGVATRLVGLLTDEARRLGCRTAWVLTESDNVPAIALYERLGGGRDGETVLFEIDLEVDSA